VVVHVSEETATSVRPELVEGLWSDCRFEDGVGMAAETCRRLACDCSLVHVTEADDGDPLNIGRKTRSIPPALKRALNARDKGCRFPGCCNTKWTDGHHIHHWANGGETKLSNLVTLCRFHHHLVHEGGWSIQVLDDGAFQFLKPGGVVLSQEIELPRNPDQSPFTSHQSRAPAQWRGDKMDYGLAVQVLCQREARAGKWNSEHPKSREE
jgi:hypothetical protein